jgi:hypothetical protein
LGRASSWFGQTGGRTGGLAGHGGTGKNLLPEAA